MAPSWRKQLARSLLRSNRDQPSSGTLVHVLCLTSSRPGHEALYLFERGSHRRERFRCNEADCWSQREPVREAGCVREVIVTPGGSPVQNVARSVGGLAQRTEKLPHFAGARIAARGDMRVLRFLLLALVSVVALGACERAVVVRSVYAESDESPQFDDQGRLEVALGERVLVWIYGTKHGFEATGFSCDQAGNLTTSDTATLAVEADAKNYSVNINAEHYTSKSYVVTALRLGDATLEGSCAGLTEQVAVHVVETRR